jgi:hypothetical protein
VTWCKSLISLARPERFERPTPRFVVWCSIQLSYGRVFRRHFRTRGLLCRVQSEYIFCRSRKRAIANGSDPAWQAPETQQRGSKFGNLVVIPGIAAGFLRPGALDHDAIKWNRIMISSLCLSMIFSENRFPLFRIMLEKLGEDPTRRGRRLYARARSLRMVKSSTGRSGRVIRKVAPIVPSTR